MKAIALKVKNYSSNVHIVNNNIQRSLLSFLLMSLGGLMVLYSLFLGIMVFNIVERRATEAEIRTVSNDVGSMELEYLVLSNKIDLNLSHSLGFKETNTKFATRKSLGSIKIVNNDI
jgi:hypothetical protein